jgi:hypothetical protein
VIEGPDSHQRSGFSSHEIDCVDSEPLPMIYIDPPLTHLFASSFLDISSSWRSTQNTPNIPKHLPWAPKHVAKSISVPASGPRGSNHQNYGYGGIFNMG